MRPDRALAVFVATQISKFVEGIVGEYFSSNVRPGFADDPTDFVDAVLRVDNLSFSDISPERIVLVVLVVHRRRSRRRYLVQTRFDYGAVVVFVVVGTIQKLTRLVDVGDAA